MSNEDDMRHFFNGIWVTVKMKKSGDRYSGTVTFCDVEYDAFGLKDVERAGRGEHFSVMEGFYQFSRKDVELIAASEVPPAPSRSSNLNMPSRSSYLTVTDPSATAPKPLEDKEEPPSLDPPSLDPPSLDPPSLDPSSLDPPSLDPPSLDPPSLDPPSLDPPSK